MIATPQMLWGSQAEKMVKQSLLAAKWTADVARQTEARQRLDILGDDWADLLWRKITQIYKSEKVLASVRGLLSTEHNVLKRIATELSTVYKWGATRELKNATQDAVARQLWAESKIDMVLERGNLFLNTVRDLFIVPQVFNGRMKLQLLTPDRVRIIQHPEDPTEIVAAWWERIRAQSPNVSTHDIVYCDAEEWRIYDTAGHLKEARPHGLGRLPATIVHAEEPCDSFWGDTAFRDVVDATLMVGVLLTMLGRLQYLQSELQPTYQGQPGELKVGQGIGGETIWSGPGTFGVLDLQGDTTHYIQHINARIGWIAQGYGLSADVYNLSSTETSGFSLKLKRLPLLEQRAKQTKIWRAAENDLWHLMAAVAQQDHPILNRVDPATDFSVNFSEEPFIEDPREQTQSYDDRIRQGRMSPYDVLIEDDPDLDREKAIAKSERIQAEKLKWDQAHIQTNTPQDPSKGPGKTPEQNGADGGRASAAIRRERLKAALGG